MDEFSEWIEQVFDKIDEGKYLVVQGDLREGLQRFLMVQAALEPLYEQIAKQKTLASEVRNLIATTLATNLGNIGYVYRAQGDLVQALECAQCALQIDENITPNSTETARDLNNIGTIYQAQGDLTQALYYYERALKIDEVIAPDSVEMASHLNNIASIYRAQGDVLRALECCERALKIDEVIAPDSVEMASDLSNIGYIYDLKGDWLRALEYYQRALRIDEAISPNSMQTATRLNNIGGVYQGQGDLAQALNYFQRALVISKGVAPNAAQTAVGLSNIGYIYRARGDLAQALKFYEQAIVVRESLRERATDRQSRELMSSLTETLHPYVASIDIRNERRNTEDTAAAFHTGEMLRARILTERLTEHRYEPANENEVKLLNRWRVVQGRYDQIYTVRQRAERDVTIPLETRAQILAVEREAKQEQDALWKQVETQAPAFATLFNPAKPLTLAEVQSRVLTPGTLLISYCVSGGLFIGWAVRQKQVDWLKIDEECMTEAMVILRTHVANGIGLTQLAPEAVKAAEKLEDMLLPTSESSLWEGVTNLLIIPDGPLYYLPFELLPSLESFPITYVPSATTLDEMRRRDMTSVTGAFLGFGDPDCGSIELDDGGQATLSRLPQARVEVEQLKEKHSGEVKIYTDKDATKSRVIEKSPCFRRLHFATHGKFDGDDPFASYLVFAPDEGKTANADKLLTARELLGVHLCAELVVCSACETGLGKIQSGEGLMGLSRAFLAAGARCLVVSLWRVADRGTRAFMECFYDNLSNHTVEVALLLTRQQMQKGIWRHPYYWAGFVAYGITTNTLPA